MTPERPKAVSLPFIVTAVIFLTLVANFVLRIVQMQHGLVMDFDAFYIAGQLLREGKIAEIYDPAVMLSRLTELAGHPIFMPWAYPPQFDVVTMALPLVSRALAFAVFVALTFGAYLLILRRMAGEHFWIVLFALVPTLLILIRSGQNGFLTGALCGLFGILWMKRLPSAGVPLGLMIIKPHLGLGLGLFALLSRHWTAVLVAALVVLTTSILSTLVLGWEVWPAFLAAPKVVSEHMSIGSFPMHRMVSAYALFATIGIPTQIAILLHAVVAVAALAYIAFLATKTDLEPRVAVGLSLCATLLVSPYAYDYDIAIVGMGFAFVAPTFLENSSRSLQMLAIGFLWLAGGWGYGVNRASEWFEGLQVLLAQPMGVPTPASIGLVGLNLTLWWVLMGSRKADAAPTQGTIAGAGRAG